MVHFIPSFGLFAPHAGASVQVNSYVDNIATIGLGALAFFSAHLVEKTNPGLAAVIRCVVGGAGLVWLFNRCCPGNDSFGVAHHHHHVLSVDHNPYVTPVSHHKHYSQPIGWNKPMWQAPFSRFFYTQPVSVQQPYQPSYVPVQQPTQHHQQAKTAYTANLGANFPNVVKVDQAAGGFPSVYKATPTSASGLNLAPLNRGPNVQSSFLQPPTQPQTAKTTYSMGPNVMGSGNGFGGGTLMHSTPQSKCTAPPAHSTGFPNVDVHKPNQGNHPGNSLPMFQAAKNR